MDRAAWTRKHHDLSFATRQVEVFDGSRCRVPDVVFTFSAHMNCNDGKRQGWPRRWGERIDTFSRAGHT